VCLTVLALDDGVVFYGLDLSTWRAWAAERDLPAGSADNVPVFVGRRVVRFHWRSACHFQIRLTVPMKTSDGLEARLAPHTLQRTAVGSMGRPRVRLGILAWQTLHRTSA
jgi:hypothetical protein